MLTVLVAISLLVAANSVPLSPVPPPAPEKVTSNSGSTPVPIVSQTDVDNGDGNFTFGFQAGNGIVVQESGYVKQGPQIAAKSAGGQPEDTSVQVITGSFSYPAPDGTNISLTYVADENGFQPQGDHLPTPPPLPESVQRLLANLGNAPASGNAPALQASPSANYENIVQPSPASRSGKSIENAAAPAAVASPAASPAALPSAAPAPASTSAAAPSSPAAPAS